MGRESWKVAADEDAYARITGVGLLVEVAGVGMLALLAWFFDGLSALERQASALVVGSGLCVGFLALFLPRLLRGSYVGRLLLGFAAASQVALLLVIGVQLKDYADPGLGIEPGAIAFDLFAASFAVLLLTGCVRAIVGAGEGETVRSRRKTASRAGFAAAVICVALGVGAAVASSTGLRCATFEFDRDRWEADESAFRNVTDRERVAESLVECRTLIGKTPREVRTMLGAGGGRGNAGHYSVGWVNDAIGVGDAQQLILGYDAEGRVRRAGLTYDD